MGMFSQACATDFCGHKDILIAEYTPTEYRWMSDAVVITPNGSLIRGTYHDGYGTIDGREYALGLDGNNVYHQACWELAGKPTEHDPTLPANGDSSPLVLDDGRTFRMAIQGFNFDDDYLIDDPRLTPAG